MDQQPVLFSDADVQTEGSARPWRLKWGVVPTDAATDETDDQAGEEAA